MTDSDITNKKWYKSTFCVDLQNQFLQGNFLSVKEEETSLIQI